MDYNENVNDNNEIINDAEDIMSKDEYFKAIHTEEYLDHFKHFPKANVIGKEAFEQRVAEVFHVLWEALSRSFGPYGANTTILTYPYSHVTKDGFTIMKNLSMNAADTLVDQSIANLASDICGRLNYSVGDGTTTAIIATNGIYERYMESREALEKTMMLPRDVSDYFKKLIGIISEKLKEISWSIQSDDDTELYNNIYKVVYISSNGDKEISEYIANFYKELHCPAITAEISPDGITRAELITGYQINAMLSDKLYINSDDEKMNLSEADIVIFTVKVNKTIYENIVRPMNEASRQRGRHLLCLAPSYDTVLIDTVVKGELNDEYRKSKSINLVLMSYPAFGKANRNTIEDFAILCNTVTLDQARCTDIMKQFEDGKTFGQIFNMDDREGIPNLKICVRMKGTLNLIPGNRDNNYGDNFCFEIDGDGSNKYRVGFVRNMSLGMKKSVFREFFYDENRYEVALNDAKTELRDLEEKYKNLGTFNTDVSIAQARYYALQLKMGLIQVGGEGDLSRRCLKDQVDDAVRAAASAYNNGCVLGCNTSLIKILFDMWDDSYKIDPNSTETILLNILLEGFLDVYRTVLSNAFDDTTLCHERTVRWSIDDSPYDVTVRNLKKMSISIFDDVECGYFKDILDILVKKYGYVSYHDLIIYYGVKQNMVFDVSKKEYSKEVINSTQTDTEVLKATVDLITLLIVSNQMLVTQKRNFDM